MLNRVNKLLIGTDIPRTDPIVLGGTAGDPSTDNPAVGEILVLDKNKKIATAGITIVDSDTLYIVEAVAETYDYTTPNGTSHTKVPKLIFSDPIEGKLVKGFSGKSYVAKGEQTSAVTLTGCAPAAGTEYIVRVIYKDLPEHPGSFTQTYRHIATATSAATVTTLVAALAAVINAHKGRRVNATVAGDVLTLTAKAIPECTSSLANIDEFSMVEFTPLFLYVDSSGDWQTIPSTSTTVTTTAAVKPQGSWEVIRDAEKAAQGYKGISNRIHFPIIIPDFRTVKAETYDQIVIEHDKSYQSPDNQYIKQAPLTTVIALPDTITTNQGDEILSVLNPWMASLPGAFSNINI